MRFGMSGCFLPDDMADLTVEMCARIRAGGFSGIFTRFRANHPRQTSREAAIAVRDLLRGEGLCLYQAIGHWPNLITSSETVRAEGVRILQAALAVAGWMGARAVETGPGSMNPDGPWFPHPDNHSAGARRQLVRSLRDCAKAAEDAGVFLTIEGHQLVTLRNAAIMRDVLDEVDSDWVRADYDCANWITLDTVFDTTAAIDADFDTLGPRIASCHAKDSWIENRLTLHLQDGCPGKGRVDFRRLFQRMEALDPEYPIIAEGNTTEELPAVGALFARIAADLGVCVLGAPAWT